MTVLFTGAAAEGILHTFPKLRPLPRTYIGEHSNTTGRSNLIADPVIGWRLKPSQSFGSTVHYRSNSAGFRSDREFAPPSRDRHRVIALIGDSFTFGYGVEYRDTFGARVEAALPGTDVYNYGMTGFAMDQMWLTMHTRALAAAPSLVVVAFISGDFSRTLEAFRPWEGFTKPVYCLHNGRLLPESTDDIPGPVVRFLDTHSSLWRTGRLALRSISHRVPWGEWWHLNEALLDQIRADSQTSGTPLLFVYIPTAEWRRFPALLRHMQCNRANLIDMSSSGALPPAGTTLRDGHLNAAGHAWVAAAILEWIGLHVPELRAVDPTSRRQWQ